MTKAITSLILSRAPGSMLARFEGLARAMDRARKTWTYYEPYPNGGCSTTGIRIVRDFFPFSKRKDARRIFRMWESRRVTARLKARGLM